MSRTAKDTSMVRKKKSANLNDLSIMDAENFVPPQQSSTPSKIIKMNPKRILRDNNSLNISIINKQDQNKKVDAEIDNEQYKPVLSAIKENYKCIRVPELFYSDPEEEEEEEEKENDEKSTITENITTSVANKSDDKWTTLSDTSEDQSCTNVSDIIAEIEADLEVRFEKQPRRSYPGRKRSNKSMFEDEKENDEVEVKVTKKDKKPKQKKKVDPQEEAFIRSINEHFNDVETFSLIVE